jgi:EAL domain-containing protein (putative c-di-GMP-specific phosphodiesterase class I)
MSTKTFRLSPEDVSRALDAGEFGLVFQPQLDVASGAAVSAEAYVRWNHPVLGILTPQLFLPFLEARQLSGALFARVLDHALAAQKDWENQGLGLRVAVNLSPADVSDPGTVATIAGALGRHGVPAGSLGLDLPEAAFQDGNAQARETAQELHVLGCRLALDSGPALPVDALDLPRGVFSDVKLGGSAIIRFAEIARNLDAGRIARRLRFARENGLGAVAVGVESVKTLNALVKLGVTGVQGQLIRRPLPLAEMLAWDGTWDGEPERATVYTPAARPRAAAPLQAAAPAPRMIEELRPDPSAYDLDEEDEYAEDREPLDVLAGEPEDDLLPEAGELATLERLPSLSAAMVDRPVRRRPMAPAMPALPVEAAPANAATDVETPVIRLRVKKERSASAMLLQRTGLARLFGV